MTSDARISVGLPGHPKTKKLIRRAGVAGAWHLVCLFLWAADNRSNGELTGMSDEDNGADNVFSIWRAQKDEAPANPNDSEAVAKWQEQQNDIDAKLILKKQREDGVQDYTQVLWFDKASMQYRTTQRHYPLRFVEFSTQDQEVPQ